MATSWFIDAVMETASLQKAALIEAEDMRAMRSGYLDEKTRSIHQASSGSAEQEAVEARQPGKAGGAGSKGNNAQASSIGEAIGVRKQQDRGQAQRALRLPSAGKPNSKSRLACSSVHSKASRFRKALPNPSIKPSPNG